MNKVFFGEKGLTSTSANHLSNMAKEAYSKIENELNSICFFTTEVSLIGTANKDILSEGKNPEFLTEIETKLNKICQLKSLIAWFREAIKARENLKKEIDNTTLTEYCLSKGIKMPVKPLEPISFTENDYIQNLSVKDRMNYFAIETKCAVYGKYIHESGKYDLARNNLLKKLSNPKNRIGNGRDSIIESYVPTISIEEVDSTYFDLQNKYREAQASLNALKAERDNYIYQENIKAKTAYAVAYTEYSEELKVLKNEFELWGREELNRIQSLKIVIPNKLQAIYEEVSNL